VVPAETVIIAGPTGAGKTDLSLRLAEFLHGEIVGADAFQIYAGLPILTAQAPEAMRAGIPHHLVGTVDPADAYDAGRYLREVQPILQRIVAHGRTPIVVGGTGLYIKALLGGLEEMPGNDPALRKQFAAQTMAELIARLEELDPKAPSALDLANRRRVERALEIVLLTGKPLAASRTGKKATPSGIRVLLVTRDREDLHARIAANVLTMFEQGVEQEVALLPEENTGPTASMTLGLRELRALARGEISSDEAKDAIFSATRRYAKRQMTWFANQHDFPVLNLSTFWDAPQAVAEALRLLGK
jgi:tRNA dimethylallyltransferase